MILSDLKSISYDCMLVSIHDGDKSLYTGRFDEIKKSFLSREIIRVYPTTFIPDGVMWNCIGLFVKIENEDKTNE